MFFLIIRKPFQKADIFKSSGDDANKRDNTLAIMGWTGVLEAANEIFWLGRNVLSNTIRYPTIC